MWKLFEKALGRSETEEPARDSRQPKQDSGAPQPGSGAETRSAGSGNGGAVPAARDGRDERMTDQKMPEEKAGAEKTAGSIPQASPSDLQPAAGPDPSAGVDSAANSGSAANAGTDPAELESKIKAAMRTVYDPEIPINIYELGLVYGLQVAPEGKVHVQMTLTAPSCPEAQTLPASVQKAIQEVPGVSEATVELVWEPTWTPQKMSEAARLQLGIF